MRVTGDDTGAGLHGRFLPLAGLAALTAGALASVATASPIPAAFAAGVIALVLSFRHPRFAALAIIFLWAGPFATQAAGRRIAGVALDAADVLVLAALAGHVFRCWWERRPLTRQGTSLLFVVPLILYLMVLVFGLVRGLMMGNARGTAMDALLSASALSAYLVFRIAYDGRLRTFASDVVGVAVAGSTLLVVAAAAGFAPQLGVVVDNYFTRGVQDGSLRVDAPVQRIAILALLLVAVGAAPYKNPGVLRRLILALPLVAALAVSQTRSTWLPVIVAVVVIPALALRGRHIPMSLLRRGVVTLFALVIALGLGSSGVMGSYVEGISTRFLSAADSEVLQDDSYQQRLVENEKALLRISEEPVWGIGFPRPYGAFIRYWPEHLDIQVHVARDFIHNSYLGMAMFFGIPGVLALAVLVAGVLVLVRRTAMAAPRWRPVPLACLGALGVLALTSTFQTQLGYEPFYLTMALVLAMADIWLNDRRFGRPLSGTERHPGHMPDRSPWLGPPPDSTPTRGAVPGR